MISNITFAKPHLIHCVVSYRVSCSDWNYQEIFFYILWGQSFASLIHIYIANGKLSHLAKQIYYRCKPIEKRLYMAFEKPINQNHFLLCNSLFVLFFSFISLLLFLMCFTLLEFNESNEKYVKILFDQKGDLMKERMIPRVIWSHEWAR